MDLPSAFQEKIHESRDILSLFDENILISKRYFHQQFLSYSTVHRFHDICTIKAELVDTFFSVVEEVRDDS